MSELETLGAAEETAHARLLAADVNLYNAVDDWTTERELDRDQADEHLLAAHKAYSDAWEVWACANREYQDERRRISESEKP